VTPYGAAGGSSSRAATPTAAGGSSSRPVTPSSSSSAAAGGGGSGAAAAAAVGPLGPGLSSISEVMSQLDRQAESTQPFWQEGTEAAADMAAKAYEAAVEWHQHWRRPGRM